MLVEPGSTSLKAASVHCCQPSDIIFFLCYNDQATDVYICMKTSPAWCVPCQWRPLWRVSQASRSVRSLSTTCKQLPDTIRTVEVMHDKNCKLWILPDAWTALMFALLWETAPVCVFPGTFSAGRLLLHVRVWTEASHQWLFTHCQGVVESMLHICSHLAPRSDKNNVLHREGLHAKLLSGNTSVNTFRMRHYTCNTCWPSGRGAVFWGFTSSCSILSSLTSQFDDSG